MKLFAWLCTAVYLSAFATGPSKAQDVTPSTLLGFDLPGGKAAADALLWFELPDAQALFESAVERYEEASVEIAKIMPQLKELGFAVTNFKTEFFPPSGRLRLISKNTTIPSDLVAAPVDVSTVAALVLKSAQTAKKVQAALGLEVVVMDVVIGVAPSVKVTYLNSFDEAQLTSQLQDINDSCSAAPQ